MSKSKKTKRNPVEAYKACPSCKSKELIFLNVDVLCGNCDWMSCEAFVQNGGMDNIIQACQDHFIDIANLKSSTDQKTLADDNFNCNQAIA